MLQASRSLIAGETAAPARQGGMQNVVTSENTRKMLRGCRCASVGAPHSSMQLRYRSANAGGSSEAGKTGGLSPESWIATCSSHLRDVVKVHGARFPGEGGEGALLRLVEEGAHICEFHLHPRTRLLFKTWRLYCPSVGERDRPRLVSAPRKFCGPLQHTASGCAQQKLASCRCS